MDVPEDAPATAIVFVKEKDGYADAVMDGEEKIALHHRRITVQMILTTIMVSRERIVEENIELRIEAFMSQRQLIRFWSLEPRTSLLLEGNTLT